MQGLTLMMSADMEVEWMEYCEDDLAMFILHGLYKEGGGEGENP